MRKVRRGHPQGDFRQRIETKKEICQRKKRNGNFVLIDYRSFIERSFSPSILQTNKISIRTRKKIKTLYQLDRYTGSERDVYVLFDKSACDATQSTYAHSRFANQLLFVAGFFCIIFFFWYFSNTHPAPHICYTANWAPK